MGLGLFWALVRIGRLFIYVLTLSAHPAAQAVALGAATLPSAYVAGEEMMYFSADGASVEHDESALDELARRALDPNTGQNLKLTAWEKWRRAESSDASTPRYAAQPHFVCLLAASVVGTFQLTCRVFPARLSMHCVKAECVARTIALQDAAKYRHRPHRWEAEASALRCCARGGRQAADGGLCRCGRSSSQR